MTKKARPAPKPQRKRHYIKEWREHRGYNQETLAEMIGKSRGLIGQIETYKTNPDASMAALAEALRCTVDDLWKVNPKMEGQVVDIMDLLRDASPEVKAKTLGYVQGLTGKPS